MVGSPSHAFEQIVGHHGVVLYDEMVSGLWVVGEHRPAAGVPAVVPLIPDDTVLVEPEPIEQRRKELFPCRVRHYRD